MVSTLSIRACLLYFFDLLHNDRLFCIIVYLIDTYTPLLISTQMSKTENSKQHRLFSLKPTKSRLTILFMKRQCKSLVGKFSKTAKY